MASNIESVVMEEGDQLDLDKQSAYLLIIFVR
jgi:hypothetical protein